jgi:oligoribonuclease
MPTLEDFFHYRNLDVSTIKELVGRWAPDKKMVYTKESSHLAMDDIRDSIDELRHYRDNVMTI